MSETNAVAIKLPTFWTTQPDVWFQQAEAQFHIRKITDDVTKYYYVISALSQEAAGRIRNLLDVPPDSQKYQAIKTRLLSVYGLTRRERAARILQDQSLGDRKPSEVMDEMLALLGPHATSPPCMLFEHAFLQVLPAEVRIQLANIPFDDPRGFAEVADSLCMARSQAKYDAPYSVNKVAKPSNTEGMCSFHQRFGEKAYRCRKPCTFQGNREAGRQ